MRCMAYGMLRITPYDFEMMTPTEFAEAVEGFQDLEQQRAKVSIENARFIAFNALKPHLKDKHATMQSVFPLPWETTTTEYTEEYKISIARKKLEGKLKAGAERARKNAQ